MNNSRIIIPPRPHHGFPSIGYQQWLLGAVFMAGLFASCKKDKDTDPPHVTITTPANGSSVQVPGEVLVRAEVSDDNPHIEVTVSVSAGNLSGFVPTQVTHIEGSSGVVEVILHFVDERILSCDATITVRATDGSQDARAFRDLTVIASPLRRRALFAVNAPPGGPATVYKADSVGTVTPFYTMSMDVQDALVSSYHKRLLLIGDIIGPIMGINAETGQSSWAVNNEGSGSSTWFQAALLGPDNRLYESTKDGAFVAHHPFNGTHELNAFAQADRTITCFGMEGGQLITQEEGIGGPQRDLVVRSTQTGAELDVQALDFDVVGMFPGNDDHLLLFGNTTADGRIEDRNVSNGLPVELLTIPGETIGTVVSDGEERFWLLLPGRVAAFSSGASAAPTLWSGTATDIAYDAADDLIWLASGSTALALNANTGAAVGSVSFPLAIDHLGVFLNR